MKASAILLWAGLASAQLFQGGGLGLGAGSGLNILNSAAAARGVNLGGLNVPGLDLNGLDVGNRNSMARGIQALLANLCLDNAIDSNSIMGLGGNNQVDLFLELARLEQLRQGGFVSLGGVRNLFNSGRAGNGFSVGRSSSQC
jgi:hypothetical protein